MSSKYYFLYKENKEGNITITGIQDYSPVQGTVIIPSIIDHKMVTTIGPYAMTRLGITGVKIPSSVSKISKGAFCENEITSIEIEEGDNLWAIDGYAFSNNPIETINLPKNITYIGIYAFSNCIKLKEINAPGVTKFNHHCFQHCESLEKIILPFFCNEIGEQAFDCPNLEEVEINPFFESMNKKAFPSTVKLTGTYNADLENAIRNRTSYNWDNFM